MEQAEHLQTIEWMGTAMTKALKGGFPPFANDRSLRSAIELICAKFGRVTHLEIFPATRRPTLQCACVLRLESGAAHVALRSKLNVIEIDGRLAFFAEVDETWTGAVM